MDESHDAAEIKALVQQLLELELERRARSEEARTVQDSRLAAIEMQKLANEHRREENLAQAKRARQQARTQYDRLIAILQGQTDLLERIAKKLGA